MGFDIFCAVCAGPVCAYIDICDRSRNAALREKKEGDANFSEKDLDKRAFRGYDPEVVRPEDVEWTYKAQVLGFNPKATGIDKTYITRPASYEDYGCMTNVSSDDPNFPEGSDDFQCYRVFDATQTVCYPIHEPCFKLLNTALCGDNNIDNLDKDSLYHILSDLTDWGLPRLDYGEPSQPYDQGWNSNPGEEMMVAYPLNNPTFTLLLRSTVSTDDFAFVPAPPPTTTTTTPTATPLASRVHNDPFARLPYDIAHELLLLLPASSLLALCTASHSIHATFASSDNGNRTFWRRAIRRCMPWFRELHVLMRHGTVDEEETDFRGLFLWAERCSRPRRGLAGPWMGVANRRRIWAVCEQFEALYAPRVRAKEAERAAGEEAGRIWEGARNKAAPVVAWPLPEQGSGVGLRTVAVQWVREWVDRAGVAVLEASWDRVGTLVGLAMVVGGERRTFGGKGVRIDAVELEEGCWVETLVLHIPDVFLTAEAATSVKGITVRMTNGKEGRLGDTNPEYCQRLLPSVPKHIIVGIMGHITSDNRITRLGLLEHRDPSVSHAYDHAPAAAIHLPLLHQPLWQPPTGGFTTITSLPSNNHHPISATELGALPSSSSALSRYQIQNPWHEDVVPTSALIWAADERERRALVRITAWLHDGTHVVCARAEYTLASGIAPREVGPAAVRRMLRGGEGVERMPGSAAGVVGGVGEEMWWREWAAGMREVVLDVDGPGGEEVVGVDVVNDAGIKAVRIRTNEGQAYWGESPIKDYWHFENCEAPEGQKVAGVALAFTFGSRVDDVAHRWEDGSEMVLRENPQLSWLATLVSKQRG